MNPLDSPSKRHPAIALSVFHQAPGPAAAEEYEGMLKEFRNRIVAEAANLSGSQAKSVQEAIARESQALRGALSEFLHTPVRTDNAEVQRIFGESFSRFHHQVTGGGGSGQVVVYTERLRFPAPKSTFSRKALLNGKKLLAEFGLGTTRANGPLFESLIVMRDGLTADALDGVLESARDASSQMSPASPDIRRRLGGYSPFPAAEFAPPERSSAGQWGGTLLYSLPDAPGAVLQVREFALAVARPQDKRWCSVWRRRFEAGSGPEWMVRLVCDTLEEVLGTFGELAADKRYPLVRTAMTGSGSMLVKEIIA